MKGEAALDYFILNGTLCSTDNEEGFHAIQGQSIYEVIRIIDRVPLYLEEHLERMRKSGELLGYKIKKSNKEIVAEMKELMASNGWPNMNVKLLCSRSTEEELFLQYFVESHYPPKDVYERGIHTILFHSERDNPNAKVVNLDLRKRIGERMKMEGAFEAILVNQDGYVTEGSRSNMFFVKGDQVYTAPPGEVLLGVTRMRIMEVCKSLGISVIERHIHEKEISDMDGAFMTGTSVNVLPIRSTDGHHYAAVHHPIIEQIAQGYQKDMDAYRASSEIR